MDRGQSVLGVPGVGVMQPVKELLNREVRSSAGAGAYPRTDTDAYRPAYAYASARTNCHA